MGTHGAEPEIDPERILRLGASEHLSVPPTVMSYSPASNEARLVDVRRAIGGLARA